MSIFETVCPLCGGKLWIDLSSGKIVDSERADHKKADLEEFIRNQKDRSSELEDMFKKASLEKEKQKRKLEEKFRKAKENPDDIEGDYHSPFEWE